MDVPVTNETIANIGINTANPTNFPSLVVCKHFDKEGLVVDDSGDSSSVRITPHYESIRAAEESFIAPIYTPEVIKSALLEVSIAFFPNYLPRINPNLEGLLYVDMEKIERKAESSRRESAALVPPPFYIPAAGPSII